MNEPEVLPFQSDCYVEVYDVVDPVDGSSIANADVKVNLWDLTGAPVANASNLTATYDTPNNLYRATIPDDATVVYGQNYRCEVVMTKGGLVSRIWADVVVHRWRGDV